MAVYEILDDNDNVKNTIVASLGFVSDNFPGRFREVPQPPEAPINIKEEIVRRTQLRLDDFAKTRNYDGILSACTYATSSIAKFRIEGEYTVTVRDLTWSTLYQILADVESGDRHVPTSYEEIEVELPVLEWPAQ